MREFTVINIVKVRVKGSWEEFCSKKRKLLKLHLKIATTLKHTVYKN
jgi:hypothetical protein